MNKSESPSEYFDLPEKEVFKVLIFQFFGEVSEIMCLSEMTILYKRKTD